ncbi:MAG: autotransporter outer membrane beta-barrel domain-containing protein, partial [Dialister micraerophilus]|nr:autotransporter outer membrane beta-barrel domain-containing protein [Dialister micraerophilus]
IKATHKNVYVKANVYLNNYDQSYAKKVEERSDPINIKKERGIEVVGEIELGLEKEIKKDVTIHSAVTYRTGKYENNMKVKLGVSAKF